MSTRLLDLAKVESENLDLYKETFEWLASLTLEDDHEDGERFIKFVEGNLERDDPFRTFILIDDGQVMGTASVIPDDHDVGKKYDIPGVWIGGVNIHRDFRGRGLGTILFQYIEHYLQSLDSKPLQVNLFTNNPVALHMYEKAGYKKQGLKIPFRGSESEICSKIYP